MSGIGLRNVRNLEIFEKKKKDFVWMVKPMAVCINILCSLSLLTLTIRPLPWKQFSFL